MSIFRNAAFVPMRYIFEAILSHLQGFTWSSNALMVSKTHESQNLYGRFKSLLGLQIFIDGSSRTSAPLPDFLHQCSRLAQVIRHPTPWKKIQRLCSKSIQLYSWPQKLKNLFKSSRKLFAMSASCKTLICLSE